MKIRFKETQKIINRFFLLIFIISSVIKCGSVMDMLDPKVEDTSGTTSSPRVFFDKNDPMANGVMSPQSIPENTSANLNLNVFMKPGFVFAGWSITPLGAVSYINGGNLLIGTSDITLYAKWTWANYNLRDVGPAGGFIFYINPNSAVDGWKYLEAAPVDQGFTTWSNMDTTLLSGTSTTIGSGPANTALIVNQAGHSTSAAKECANYSLNGFSGWFLPSRDELVEMRNALYLHSVGGLLANVYWSSSEYAITNFQAHVIDFPTGSNWYDPKNSSYYFRAIRRF